MLKNLKIWHKVALGFFIVIAIAAAVVIFTMNNIRRIDWDYSQLMNSNERVYIMIQIPTDIANLRRLITTAAFRTGQLDFLPGLYQDMNQVHASFISRVSDFRANVAADNDMDATARERYFEQMDELERLINFYMSDIVAPTFAAAFDDDIDTVLSFGVAEVPVVGAMTEIYGAIVAQSMTHVRETHASLNTQAVNARTIGIIVSFIGMASGIVIATAIVRNVSLPINKIAKILKDVSAGNINVNINRNNLSKDEIGDLTQDVCTLVDVVRNMVLDLSKVHEEYINIGNIHYVIDDSKYQNSFKDMVGLVNHLLTSVTVDILEVADVLSHMSNGNFNKDMNTEVWVGGWAAIPAAVNGLTINLTSVNTEIKAMIKAAAVNGNLAHHVDASKFNGDWNAIMNGLNDICNAINTPVVEIRDALSVLNKGLFNARINGDYAGDFLSIKKDFNIFIKNTADYMVEINSTLSAIAHGDLKSKIAMDFIGEYAATKQAVNDIADTLHKTMSEISVASEQVHSGATQISTSASDLANGAQEQSSSVEELNATIDVISQQTQQNAENAVEASELSNKSTFNAIEGHGAMKQMLVAMTQIRESSTNISAIIKIIQDIAFQTNLLSLNASVEAARAGEHGRGFAVVADEVRNLAARSQKSANETTDLIQNSIDRVESGADIAETTSASLDIIVNNANEISEIINNISLASREQADAISQVSKGLSQISKVVQSNSAVSEETAAASQELSSQADLLQQLVAYFKL